MPSRPTVWRSRWPTAPVLLIVSLWAAPLWGQTSLRQSDSAAVVKDSLVAAVQDSITAAIADSLQQLQDSTTAADSARTAAKQVGGSGDNVNEALQDVHRDRDGLIEGGFLDHLHTITRRAKDAIFDRTNVRLGFAYTLLYQGASEGTAPLDGGSGDLDLFGKWYPLQAKGYEGGLGFYLEWRHQIGDITPQDLGDQFGSQWNTTWAFGTRPFSLVQLWWEQYLYRDWFRITVGKINPTNYYNFNRSQNVNKRFVNAMFSSNPTIPWAGNGIGVNLWFQPADWFYVSTGTSNGNASSSGIDVTSYVEGELFSLAEVGVSPRLRGRYRGNYRFTIWHYAARPEQNLPDDRGWAFSLDQDLAENVMFFFRTAHQETELIATKDMASAGLMLSGPLGLDDDLMGFAFGWGRPFDSQLPDQYTVEMFYRIHLTSALEFSPVFTGIFDPTFDPSIRQVYVLSLRVRLSY